MGNPVHIEKVRALAESAAVDVRESRAEELSEESLVEVIMRNRMDWGDWRRAHSEPLDLSGADFSGALLAGLDFSGANLAEARFVQAHLARCLFTGADLTGASFEDAQLWNLVFDRATLRGADFTGAEIAGAPSFNGADLSDAVLRGAVIWAPQSDADTRLDRADVTGCHIKQPPLRAADSTALAKAFVARMSDEQRASLARETAGTHAYRPPRGCFIATAACGAAAPELAILRRYRDTVLARTPRGRAVIDWYCRVSPPIARVIACHPWLAAVVRTCLVRPAARMAHRFKPLP